jgi:hypothetical protein
MLELKGEKRNVKTSRKGKRDCEDSVTQYLSMTYFPRQAIRQSLPSSSSFNKH